MYISISIISVASRVQSRKARVHAILNVVSVFPSLKFFFLSLPAGSERQRESAWFFFRVNIPLCRLYFFLNINSVRPFFFYSLSRDSSREGEMLSRKTARAEGKNRIKIKTESKLSNVRLGGTVILIKN